MHLSRPELKTKLKTILLEITDAPETHTEPPGALIDECLSELAEEFLQAAQPRLRLVYSA
jgi:hypothetical protein